MAQTRARDIAENQYQKDERGCLRLENRARAFPYKYAENPLRLFAMYAEPKAVRSIDQPFIGLIGSPAKFRDVSNLEFPFLVNSLVYGYSRIINFHLSNEGKKVSASPLSQLEIRGFSPLVRLRAHIVERMVKAKNKQAEATLRQIPALWAALEEYAKGSSVTGASMSDYLTLYEQVRQRTPREVLEFGTGFSTVVLAHALMANERDGAPRGRITSMEEDAGWTATANSNLPDEVKHLVEIIHSAKIDGFYKMFRGVQYTEIPERAYDFVFSDGPERHSLVNDDKLFDLDLINIVRKSETPIFALVDNHYLTFYVLQKVFGTELARYSVRHRLMFVGPVSSKDVRHLRKEIFLPDLRVTGEVEFKLRMALDEEYQFD